MSLKKLAPTDLLIAALLFLSGLVVSYFDQIVHLHDPDRYFHLHLAQEYAAKGIVRTLPQVEDIAWNTYYPDKEFLFHVLLGIGHRLAGEPGAEWTLAAMSGFSLLGFWLLARAFLPSWSALGITLIGFLSNSYFLSRLFMLRPQVLAIGIFSIFLLALVKRNQKLAFVAAFVFALSYHAQFIILIPMLIFAASAWLRQEREQAIRLSAVTLAASAIGMIIHPFFPSNFEMIKLIVEISTGSVAEVPKHHFGNEMLPLPADVYFQSMLGFLWITLLSIAALLVTEKRTLIGKFALEPRGGKELTDRLFIVLTIFTFLTLSFYNRRALEYLGPSLIAGLAMSVAAASIHLRWAIAAVAALLTLPVLQEHIGWFKDAKPDRKGQIVTELDKILSRIAHRDSVKFKVLNIDWSMGSLILYLRPDLRFVDLLDPTFLARKQAELHKARIAMVGAGPGDPFNVARGMFDADYILAQAPLPESYNHDPNIRLIYPQSLTEDHWRTYLYQVAQQRYDGAVKRYQIRILKLEGALPMAIPAPAAFDAANVGIAWPKPGSVPEQTGSPFVDLMQVHDGKSDKDRNVCALLEVDPREVARLSGRSWLLLGGGSYLAVYVDGQQSFANALAQGQPIANRWMVPLDSALRSGQRLEVVVCKGKADSNFSFSMQILDDAKYSEICSRERDLMLFHEGFTNQALQNDVPGGGACLQFPALYRQRSP